MSVDRKEIVANSCTLGGSSYTGCTTCASPFTCKKQVRNPELSRMSDSKADAPGFCRTIITLSVLKLLAGVEDEQGAKKECV